MRIGFQSAMTVALVVALTVPAMAVMRRAPLHGKAQPKASSQITRQITVNDAATAEGEGDASGAPTGLSGQVATGNLVRDAARDSNPSNGTATNIGPASM